MKLLRNVLLAVLVLAAIAVAGIFLFAPGIVGKAQNPVMDHAPYEVSDAAQNLHDSLLIGDWHADPLLWKRDLTERGDYGMVDFPRMREGNAGLQVFTAVTKSPKGQNYEENTTETADNITLLAIISGWPLRTWNDLTERALYQAEKLHDFAEKDGNVTIILTQQDLQDVLQARAAGEARIGAILGIEGAHPLEGEMANLDRLEAAGYRLVGLQHFFDNALGGSLHGVSNAGLSEFGRAVVSEVVARGMVLDLAHSSPAVVEDVLEMTDIPLVLSHGGLNSFCDVHRNLPDDLALRIADTGGVVGMGYWPDVTCGDASPENVAQMIAAAVEVLGEDHVSLGSDYDGSVATTFDISELPALTQALMNQGLSDEQIAKVMGGNMVRVLNARLPQE